MKVAETLAASTLTLGLLTSCTSSPPPPQESDPCLASSSDVTAEAITLQAQCAYDDAKEFWTPQGVREIPSLYLPGKDETVTCGTVTITPEKGRQVAAAACYVTKTLFMWPEGLVGQVDRAVKNGAVLRHVVGEILHHDYAHFAMTQLTKGEIVPEYIEPLADCMGAAAMRNTNPDALDSVQKLYQGIEEYLGRPDLIHGTAGQRTASFTLGYTSLSHTACEEVTPLPVR